MLSLIAMLISTQQTTSVPLRTKNKQTKQVYLFMSEFDLLLLQGSRMLHEEHDYSAMGLTSIR